MVDILLTHSYFLRFDPKEERAMMPYPPLGTITAAAYLRSHGYTVALHDVMFSPSETDIRTAMELHRPRLLIIYDDNFNYLTKMCLSRMRLAAFRMASEAKRFGIPVAVFSSDSADHIDEYLDHDADYVLCGEAEHTAAELCSHVFGPGTKDLHAISGLAYRSRGNTKRTPPRPVLKDLDSLPMAAWDLIQMEDYHSAWTSAHGYSSLNISTTRGCPFHCNWCAKPLYGQVYNTRSPEAVAQEMLHLKQTYDPDHIWITDDIFGLAPGWVSQFADCIETYDAGIPFKCLSRADLLLLGRTIPDLKRAGCSSVWIGAESGSQKILDAMDKGTTVEQIRAATQRLHDHEIRVGFFLQFGYPGESWDDIQMTLSMVKECRPQEIGISVSYPLPGTPFYERVQDEMTAKQNWTDSQDLDLMFAGAFHPEFYRALHRLVHKKFGIWRGINSASQWMRHPFSPPSGIIRHLGAMAFNIMTLPVTQRRTQTLARPTA